MRTPYRRPSPNQGKHRTPVEVRSEFPHYVYRCYDAQGRLLYVGCTYDPPVRMRQHRAEKGPWISTVARVRFTVWPNRRKALDMERLAIETECPIYNKAHKPPVTVTAPDADTSAPSAASVSVTGSIDDLLLHLGDVSRLRESRMAELEAVHAARGAR